MDLNENLAKLWTKRAEILDGSAEKANSNFKARFKGDAAIYRDCARELLNPPTELLKRVNDDQS